jgi:hypothetical protein
VILPTTPAKVPGPLGGLQRFVATVWAEPIVRSAFLARAGNVAQGAIVALAIVWYLDPVQQGLWYSLASLLTVASMAEMGFGQVIVQIVAHDLHGQAGAGARRGAYFVTAVKFGVAAAAAYLVFLGAGVAVFFGNAPQHALRGSAGPVAAAAVAGALVLALSPLNSFFEGSLQIVSANHRRTLQSLAYALACFASLAAGLHLWAVPVALGVSFAVGVALLLGAHAAEMVGLWRSPAAGVTWSRDFWPLQSRYAISWFSGIFFHFALSPLLLLRSGAAEAGRFGLTWSLLQAGAGFAIIWVSSHSAKFAAWVGAGEGLKYRMEYWRRFRWSLLTFIFMSACGLALVLGTGYYAPALAGRFVSPAGVIVLVLAAGANLLMQLLMVFARSFREEPFVREAWVSSLSIAALSYVLAPAWGAIGAGLALIAGQLIILPSVLRKVRSYGSRLRLDKAIPGNS